jgi:hypothetical protein
MSEQSDQMPPDGGPSADGAPTAGSTEPAAAGSTGEATRGREWLAQLQSMIDDLATQAAPTIRQVGAKAAELAAVAGDKAGPFAQRAAEITGDAGQKLAERSRHLAEELRRDLPGDEATSAHPADAPTAAPPAADEPPVDDEEDGA